MRTLVFIVGGLFLFLLLLFTTQRSDQRRWSGPAWCFIGIWFLVALGNLVYGVAQAGYSLAEEAPIALLIFLPPSDSVEVVWSGVDRVPAVISRCRDDRDRSTPSPDVKAWPLLGRYTRAQVMSSSTSPGSLDGNPPHAVGCPG